MKEKIHPLFMDAWNEQRGPKEKRNWVVAVIKKDDPITRVFGAKITDVHDSGRWDFENDEIHCKAATYQFPINLIGDVLKNMFERKMERLIRYYNTKGTDSCWSVYRKKCLQK